MPLYCYTTEDGETVDRAYSFHHVIPKSVKVRGKVALRDRQAEGVPRGVVKGSKTPVRQGHGKWPMAPCFASGVNACQAQELRDHYKKHGVDVEVTKDGDPIYTSAAQRRKALKVRGMHDNDSFD